MNIWLGALYLVLAALTVALVYIDLKHHLLPNVFTLGSYPVVAVLLLAASFEAPDGFARLGQAALAALVSFVCYLVLHLINRSGLGLGDVKLAPVLGAVLGWHSWGAVLAGSVYAFVLAGLVAGLLLLLRRLGAKDEIAFGPFMLAGFWLALLTSGT
jgi:leader peptidase (prepilin peptidase)/N-methyltransferase